MTDQDPTPDAAPEPKYRTGDIVNGHRLGADGYWQPIGQEATPPPPPYQSATSTTALYPTAPAKRGLPTAAKVGIGVGAAFALLVGVGVIGAAFGLGDEPAATPAPAVTVTEEAPTPEPVEATPTVDPDDAIRDTPEYTLVQSFMDTAMRQSGANLTLVCLQYQKNPAKYDAQFIRVATKGGMFSYDVATVAVPDWFARKCGT